MIELRDVSRSYETGGEPLLALDRVTASLSAGGYLAVMGPSGSGKSTLLNILGCLDRPTSGEYFLDGSEVGSLSESELSMVRRHKIGFVFQSFHLIPRLSAAENVALPMLLAGVPPRERDDRVDQALAAVGLAERSRHRPAEMSGGECQRVAIARATVMRPRILLADEPTGNLDRRAGSQVMDLIEGMNAAGLTLVIVTHDPSIGRRAQEVLLLEDGRIADRIPGHELPAGFGSAARPTP